MEEVWSMQVCNGGVVVVVSFPRPSAFGVGEGDHERSDVWIEVVKVGKD